MLLALRDIANLCFDRMKSYTMDEVNFREEVRAEIKKTKLSIPQEQKKQFVKSAAYQLSLQVARFNENPMNFNLEKKGHNNQALTDFEETILCGIMMSQRQLGMKITLERVRRAAKLAFGEKKRCFSRTWVNGFKERNSDIFYLNQKQSMSTATNVNSSAKNLRISLKE